jgi:hypothetical protein
MTTQPLTILTLVIGADYRKGLQKCLDSKKAYAERHGYTYIQGDETFWDRSRPIAWSKVPFILKCLSELPEGVMVWLSDADVLITNPSLKIEEHVLPLLEPNKNFLMSLDSCGHINSGNIFFRNTEWTRDYWRRVWNETEFLYHIWWENAAMIKLYEENPVDNKNIQITPQHKKFNAFLRGLPGQPLWEPGDLLVHFAGVYNPKEISELVERIEKGEVPRLKM